MAAATVELIATGLEFPESPRRTGETLFFGDRGCVWRVDPGRGPRVLARIPDQVLGIEVVGDDVYATSAHRRRIYRIVPAGEPALLVDLAAFGAHPINEFVVLSDGTLLVGQMGYDIRAGEAASAAPLLRVAPDGSVTETQAMLTFANGMAMLPDSGGLLVAESPLRRISRIPIVEGSQVGLPESYAELEADPDGIALEVDGSVWYAAHDRVIRVAPGGAVIDRVRLPFAFTTSCLLGAPGDDHLFVTALAEAPAPGSAPSGVFGSIRVSRP